MGQSLQHDSTRRLTDRAVRRKSDEAFHRKFATGCNIQVLFARRHRVQRRRRSRPPPPTHTPYEGMELGPGRPPPRSPARPRRRPMHVRPAKVLSMSARAATRRDRRHVCSSNYRPVRAVCCNPCCRRVLRMSDCRARDCNAAESPRVTVLTATSAASASAAAEAGRGDLMASRELFCRVAAAAVWSE